MAAPNNWKTAIIVKYQRCYPDTMLVLFKSDVYYRKISLQHSVSIQPEHYSFFLPSHKGDCFFKGNIILIQKLNTPTNLYSLSWPISIPGTTVSLSIQNFGLHHKALFPLIIGSSLISIKFSQMRLLVSPFNQAVPLLLQKQVQILATIQAAGHWSSEAFQIYICKNPVLIHTILFRHPAHQPYLFLSNTFHHHVQHNFSFFL